MKRVFAVLAVFFLLLTAQNAIAQEDPFEIAKEIALTGELNTTSKAWDKEVEVPPLVFCVSYNTFINAVGLCEYPESGNGTIVMWIKDLVSGKYLKATVVIEDFQPVEKPKEISVTKEEAEKGAWEILKHFGRTMS